jgi:hypothetical protein
LSDILLSGLIGSLSKSFWGKAKDDGQLSDCQLITMTFNGKVKCRIKSIFASPSGGIELSHQLCVPLLMQTQYIINPKCLCLGDNLLEHRITLPLHVGPIDIQL